MALTLNSQSSNDGSSITSMPSHAIGDLIVIFATRGNSTSVPSLPAGYTALGTNTATTSSYRSGYKIATSTSETSGTWTGATQVMCLVFRGQKKVQAPIIHWGGQSGTSPTVNYSGITTMNEPSVSMVLSFGCIVSLNTSIETARSNSTNIANFVGNTMELAVHESSTAPATWAFNGVSVGGTNGAYMTATIEILVDTGDIVPRQSAISATNSSSTTATYPIATIAGNLLVAYAYTNSNISGLGISGWTKSANAGLNYSGTAQSVQIFYKIADGTETTVTSTGSTICRLHIAEFANVDTTSLTEDGANNNSASTSTTINTGSITTTNADDLLLVVAGTSTGETGARSWDSSFSVLKDDSTSFRLLSGYRVVSSTGTYSSTATIGATATYVGAAILAIQKAGSSNITTTQTILGKARIQATVLQTILGKARITASTLQTILGKSRINGYATKTIQGLARITGSTARTILGKSRIQNAVTQTIQGLSRIAVIIENFSEDWSGGTIDSSKWNDWSVGMASVVSGQLNLTSTLSPAYGGVDNNVGTKTYSLKSSYVVNQVVNAGNQSITSWECYPIFVQPKSDNTNQLIWLISGGYIKACKKISGVFTQLDLLAYNSTNHKYFRIRESSGTIYWDYSADNITWNNLYSLANPFAIDNVIAGQQIGTWQTESLTTTAIFDNFNIAFATTVQTILGKARVTASTLQTILGRSRIQKAVVQTILGRARVQATALQTILGKSRISGYAIKTIQGLARITGSTTKTILGKARVQISTLQTILGKSRINGYATKTIQGLARITGTTARTILGKARIQATTIRTITGTSRIQIITTRTILGVANIAAIAAVNKVIMGKARIQVTTIQIIVGRSRIQKTVNQTILGTARISISTNQTIGGRSRISINVGRDIPGKARIQTTTTKNILGKARIRTPRRRPRPLPRYNTNNFNSQVRSENAYNVVKRNIKSEIN